MFSAIEIQDPEYPGREEPRKGGPGARKHGKASLDVGVVHVYAEGCNDTFDSYCRGEWGWGSSRARQIIGTSETVNEMHGVKNLTVEPPRVESHAAPLTRIESPEQRAEVWTEVVEEAEAAQEPVTAKRVEAKIKGRRPEGPRPGG